MPAIVLAAAVLALALSPVGARADLCLSGTSIGCDDLDPCTADRCDGLRCVHTPATGPVCNDHDACTHDDRCDAGRCVGVPVVCDDGVACTDDACVGGRCTYVPIDSRCVPPDVCTSAVCAPESGGCAAGPPRRDGEECAEDGDACTADTCAGARCTHFTVADTRSCSAAQDAFRRSRALASEARGLIVSLGSRAAGLGVHLASIADAFELVARTLAGKTADEADEGSESQLQRRARAGLAILRRARAELVAAVRIAALPRLRAQVGGDAVPDLGRRLRTLGRDARTLRRELRRLVRDYGTFVR